jgi:trans-2,3-dihydro-3-hydroxyanthranilate isomerase
VTAPRRHPFLIADVFTDRAFAGGNQLAVVFEADSLTGAQMQAVAAEFGFSETTFVLRPEAEGHDARVRIFTPGRELPFAGHPTIGTALALAWRGLVEPGRGRVVLGLGAGPVTVELRHGRDGAAAAAELRAPEAPRAGRAVEPARVAAALGLDPGDLAPGGADGLPREASCGLPFLLVRLSGREALARAAMRDPGLFEGLEADAVYLFVEEGGDGRGGSAGAVRARMFSPLDGIGEDPATGSAAAALAGHLGGHAGADGLRCWRIEQGVEMGRPSLIEASALVEGGRVAEVRVAGSAVLVAEGHVAAP